MQCSLTPHREGLSANLQNPLFKISPFFKDQLEVGKKAGIAETYDVTRKKKIHYVFDREIRKLVESYHRFGESADDTDHPFSSAPRALYSSVTGEMSALTTFSADTKQIRDALFEYIHGNIREFQNDWQKIAQRHVSQWIEQGHVFIGRSVSNMLTEMVASTLLGYEGNCDPITATFNELVDGGPCVSVAQYHEQLNAGVLGKLANLFKWFVDTLKMVAVKLNAYRKLHSIIFKAADEILQNGSSKYVTFMRKKGFSDQAIKDNFISMLLAGESTISSLITFTLQEYINHPDLQDLDRQEVLDKMQQADGLEYLGNLEGPKKMLLESLRLYPPGLLTRVMRHDAVLKYGDNEHYLRKGDDITTFSGPTGRDPKMWNNPDVFDRERPGLESMSHLPFGSGVHSCPGKRAVIPEALVVLSTVLQNAEIYHVQPMPELVGQMTLKIEKDYLMGFRKRT